MNQRLPYWEIPIEDDDSGAPITKAKRYVDLSLLDSVSKKKVWWYLSETDKQKAKELNTLREDPLFMQLLGTFDGTQLIDIEEIPRECRDELFYDNGMKVIPSRI